MSEHSLLPVTEGDLAALIARIEQLAGSVVSHQEWKSLFAAARQLLPRTGKRTMEAAEVDFARLSASPAGRVLGAVTRAFASPQTFTSNRRYGIYSWIDLASEFYAIVPYTTGPLTLSFAAELLRLARTAGNDAPIAAASTIEPNEPILVRQVISRFDLDKWKSTLTERLEGRCDEGEGFLSAAQSEESFDPDDYHTWYGDSEDLVSIAAEFFDAFRFTRPADLARLKALWMKCLPHRMRRGNPGTMSLNTTEIKRTGTWNGCLRTYKLG